MPPSNGHRVIITLNAGFQNGWELLTAKWVQDVKVDYHENMTSGMFEK